LSHGGARPVGGLRHTELNFAVTGRLISGRKRVKAGLACSRPAGGRIRFLTYCARDDCKSDRPICRDHEKGRRSKTIGRFGNAATSDTNPLSEVARLLPPRHDGQNTCGFTEVNVNPSLRKYFSFRKPEKMI
jgi:hypothetical protein